MTKKTTTTTTTTLDLSLAFTAAKAFFTFESGVGTKRATKAQAVYETGLRYTDCAASTTRLDKEHWASLKFLALQTISDPATREMATMPKETFMAKKKLLEGDELKAFQDFRAKATAMAGPYMGLLGEQLLACEPKAVQKKVTDAAAKVKADKKAKKEKGETAKTMQEKIIVQLTNTVAIMQGDDEPDGFDFVALQDTIAEALVIMGIKLTK
mgnify:FL=1|tara:strand:+ start:1402 stop:2037 length:636 start_codon:yes stop_codon:yes gene_type:complete